MRPLGYTAVNNTDVEKGPVMNSLFQRNGTVNPVTSETEKKHTSKWSQKMQRMRTDQPRIGAVMTLLATTASAVAPYSTALLTAGGVVAVGTSVSLLHDATSTINNIDGTISNSVNEFTAATADSDGQSYMRDLGPGIRSGAGLLQQVHQSNIVPKIASVDFEKVSKLLTKIESADVEGLLDGVARIVESFDRVSLRANLRFSTEDGGSDGSVVGTHTDVEPSPAPQNTTGR